MFKGYLMPILAGSMLFFTGMHLNRWHKPEPKLDPPIAPAVAPQGKWVAGTGLVESRTENISLASPLPGVVEQVFVQAGQTVNPGDLLFRIDRRQLLADLKTKEANLAAAIAQQSKMKAQPRKEEVPVSQAKVDEARANVADRKDLADRTEKLFASRTTSIEELNRAKQQLNMANAQLDRTLAEHKMLLAGAWEFDQRIADAAVEQAAAAVKQTKVELERLEIRAPVVEGVTSWRVLRVNVRPSEFVAAPHSQMLLMLGANDKLHVRVDIDENDISRFQSGAKAKATMRGDAEKAFPLTFVRVEPYVTPKRSLTGDSSERVDTRVLQVIYAIEPTEHPVYVGQQLDVFIDANKSNDLVTGFVSRSR